MSDKPQSEKTSPKKRFPPWLTSSSAVMGVVRLMASALMYLPDPTRISLEAAVSRAEMTLGVFPTQQILASLEVESISFGNVKKSRQRRSHHFTVLMYWERSAGQNGCGLAGRTFLNIPSH
ncbi:MAG: hypothetical protein O2999_11740 [Nitrospirae bacterium]|nr:hypothetical protein [Nitrospirota bacterium]MDA1304948.1 hypothetical protein [Nitrospirota bacterium]